MSNYKKMFVMLSFGFASGLPFILILSTSSAWLRDVDIAKTYIGFFSWVTIWYALKFLWAPLVDRFSIPYFVSAVVFPFVIQELETQEQLSNQI